MDQFQTENDLKWKLTVASVVESWTKHDFKGKFSLKRALFSVQSPQHWFKCGKVASRAFNIATNTFIESLCYFLVVSFQCMFMFVFCYITFCWKLYPDTHICVTVRAWYTCEFYLCVSWCLNYSRISSAIIITTAASKQKQQQQKTTTTGSIASHLLK